MLRRISGTNREEVGGKRSMHVEVEKMAVYFQCPDWNLYVFTFPIKECYNSLLYKMKAENNNYNILLVLYRNYYTTLATLERECGLQSTKLNEFYNSERSFLLFFKIFSISANCFETTAEDHSSVHVWVWLCIFVWCASTSVYWELPRRNMLIQNRCNYFITRQKRRWLTVPFWSRNNWQEGTDCS